MCSVESDLSPRATLLESRKRRKDSWPEAVVAFGLRGSVVGVATGTGAGQQEPMTALWGRSQSGCERHGRRSGIALWVKLDYTRIESRRVKDREGGETRVRYEMGGRTASW